MGQITQGRVLIGGKREGFQGQMPGVLEEVLLAFEAGQPVYLAGGFGGVTWDVTRALGIDKDDWFQHLPGTATPDRRLIDGISRLVQIADKNGRASLDNGLSEEETQRLAACHRPSEIAALVSLGLGRRFQKK